MQFFQSQTNCSNVIERHRKMKIGFSFLYFTPRWLYRTADYCGSGRYGLQTTEWGGVEHAFSVLFKRVHSNITWPTISFLD